MDQWRCDVRVSWRTQLLLLVTHGILILLILLAPWPENYSFYWLVLLTLVVFECIRSQKQIAKIQGEFSFLADNHILWQHNEWELCKTPWISDFGALLPLRSLKPQGKKKRLWIAADSLTPEAWCHLRRTLMQTHQSD
uniref:protein YgfX n=1 Tax=Hafnia alvei TaxID=569 RepID=UPI00242ADC4E|nr:protein YgfX [Hafnia alvei]